MYIIGIDLGGTNIAGAILDQNYGIIAKNSVKTIADQGFEPILNSIKGLIDSLLKEQNLSYKDIARIGIGSPGTIDSKKGVVIYANNLSLLNAPLAPKLSELTGIPVKISNDANCAALGESVAGGAKGMKNMVLITLGTGVGGGVVIDKKIYEGTLSVGTELGHIVIMANGKKCSCGRIGCWEAYASASALISQTLAAIEKHPECLMAKQAKDGVKVNGRLAFDCAKAGDETAAAVVKEYVQYVACGIINIINIFFPDAILVGGGISGEGDYLLDPIRELVKNYSYGSAYVQCPQILKATLGNDAGIIGAAALQ